MIGQLVAVDHLAYLQNRRHRREVLAAFRRLAAKPGRVVQLAVHHEHDDGCCQAEAWVSTARRIQNALAADGCPVAWAFVPAEARS